MTDKPGRKSAMPRFSSGPCAKRPGWSLRALEDALVGRSHRASDARARLVEVIDLSRELLGLPADWRLGIVPASDTGAFEMAMWSLLGARGVDVLAWESFGKGWVGDIVSQLKLDDVRKLEADYGTLPDLSQVLPERDVVFTWNGTTSGVRVPNGDWISDDREGLVLCDATSAVFAMDLPWDKLDVVTWSWQKVLGGEGQHGMLALSPRAVVRLQTYTPAWPLPKIFRLTKGGKLMEGIFKGETINTPSMLCVEDVLDALRWAKSLGGSVVLVARSEKNLARIAAWVAKTDWVEFLAADPAVRSPTSVCLKIVDPWFSGLDETAQRAFAKSIAAVLAREGVAFDIAAYRDAPPGLRIWAGATIETDDIDALLPWLDWAFAEACAAA
ncbi:MAG: phosphoserine transaminase [Alphaproteobacteria bacterium]|jgi:phosphoserine aminotransferase|nr:phosphoserine transaminase [Alphaproteobacteria bacterium]MDP7234177.1 phosphoserine transaminase [Alphaproteobacteria bacterium]MDP7487701.1 phosphoserine transaminase [Alphaproteobacteria bacterium]HJN20628.1 phosphoserine transaminase [Alphaproteobacteria bacterium]|tara:strand:- start:229 stop:1386 length:1158 start_codon:yes stop_codon:yes gene_type:complete